MPIITFEVLTYEYSGHVVRTEKFDVFKEALDCFEGHATNSNLELSFDLIRVENFSKRDIIKSA